MRQGPVRPWLVAAAVGLAVGSAVVPGSVAGPLDDLPTPPALFDDPPTTDAAEALIPGDVLLGEEPLEPSPADDMRQQRPSIDLGGQTVEAEPVEADVTVEITDDQGSPVESSPAEPGADDARGPEPVEQDGDGDYVPDLVDNCPAISNVNQEDGDGDGVGDACPVTAAQYEPAPGNSDYDGDGVPDESDNCWRLANPTQKDGDGDGLGNGCDEGSAPFVVGDSSGIEAERSVEDPSLTANGETITPADPTPIPDDGRPADDRGNDRPRAETADGSTDLTAADAGNGIGGDGQNGDQAGEDGGGRGRNRGQADGDAVEPAAGGDRLSPVERGARPRRNPDLTEESGPVLPPPRNTKRLGAAPTEFVEVVRIDAGSLGDRDAVRTRKARDRADDRTAEADSDGSSGEDSSGRDDRDGAARSDRTAGDGSDRTERPGASRRAPVPIEDEDRQAGEPTPAPTADQSAGDGEESDAPASAESGSGEGDTTWPAVTGAFGWQAPPAADEEPGDGDVPLSDGATSGDAPDGANDAEPSDGLPIDGPPADDPEPTMDGQGREIPRSAAKDGDGGGERDGGKGARANRADAEQSLPWSGDEDYRGGEATLLIDGEDVKGTDQDDVFLTQRAGTDRHRDGGFVYAIPVEEDGVYRVRLYFAETWFGAPGGAKGGAGERVFDVDAEGEEALRDFDIYDEVGAMTAVVKTFDVEVDDGTIELEFKPVEDRPVVSAIEVLRGEETRGKDRDRNDRKERDQGRDGRGGEGPASGDEAADVPTRWGIRRIPL